MSTTVPDQAIAEGPGSVSGAPNLPGGFTDTFTSRSVNSGGLRQHAVIGGEGPPLLLVHGWPQTWYQYRLVMPALARDFEVIAVDQRGIGLSDKPHDGYDIGTLANDMVALMDSLGHERFALVGFDTGMFISYALAADHPDRLDRLVVGEAFVPGVYSITAPVRPRADQRAALAPRLQPARHGERGSRQRTGRHLLRRGVRRMGRDATARRRRQVLHRPPRLRPRSPARQLRAVPGARHRLRAERGAQDAAADHARPGDRRIRKRGRPSPRTR